MNKIISVYFSGTGFGINEQEFLTASLHQKTEENESHIKMGFNGCGVDYGFTGAIFGSGLDEQCEQVIARILQEINAGHQVTLNIYGHSRGAVAALLLAKQLGTVDKETLAINLAMLDPVPGNFITTSSLDPFEISLANKTMDLSDCKPLRKVLALYPHIPLPAIICHAPLLVSYPEATEVDIEVVNGCHAQAEQIFDSSSYLVQLRVEEFLVQNGTPLRTDRDYKDAETMKRIYLERYRYELAQVTEANSRDTHSAQDMIITAKTEAKYFNSRHKALAGDHSQEPVALTIEPNPGFFSRLITFFTNYPLVGQTVKWTMISLAVAGLLFATGGFAAIPLLAPIVAKLGALSIVAFAPVIGSALATLWYGAAKPLIAWCASKLFYSHYAMWTIEVPQGESTDSNRMLMTALVVTPSKTNAPEKVTEPYHGKSPLNAQEILGQQQEQQEEMSPSLS